MKPMQPMQPMAPMQPMQAMEPMAKTEAWWPAELGEPSSTGAQNDRRYAWFSKARRLAVQDDGSVTVYDTGKHRIHGFAQSRGGADADLRFAADGDESIGLESLKAL